MHVFSLLNTSPFAATHFSVLQLCLGNSRRRFRQYDLARDTDQGPSGTARAADVHPQARTHRAGHLSPYPETAQLLGCHDEQATFAAANADTPHRRGRLLDARAALQYTVDAVLVTVGPVPELLAFEGGIPEDKFTTGTGSTAEATGFVAGVGQFAVCAIDSPVAGNNDNNNHSLQVLKFW